MRIAKNDGIKTNYSGLNEYHVSQVTAQKEALMLKSQQQNQDETF